MQHSRLPIEICEHIIDLGSIDKGVATILVDHPTLRACALVCQAWLPRARYNLFLRVVLRSSMHLERFVAAAPSGQTVRELELGPSLKHLGGRDRKAMIEHQPSCTSLIRAMAKVVGMHSLVLSCMHWLYPRRYLAVMSQQFTSVRELQLYFVSFSTPGDVLRIIWSFPQLEVLQCLGVTIVHNIPAPALQPHNRSMLRSLRHLGILGFVVDLHSAGPALLNRMSWSAPSLASLDLGMAFGFKDWTRYDFGSMNRFHHLTSLRLTVALPAPPDIESFFADYQRLMQSLFALVACSTPCNIDMASSNGTCPSANLRELSITIHPGGERRGDQDFSEGCLQPRRTVDEKPARLRAFNYLTYGMSRSRALEVLIAAVFERLLVDDGTLRAEVRNLCTFEIEIQDHKEGMEDAWWCLQAYKYLFSLAHLVQIRLVVNRGWLFPIFTLVGVDNAIHMACACRYKPGYDHPELWPVDG